MASVTNSINKAYSWGIETCNAPDVGYSQKYRTQKTVNGITYYDCSSFIWYALKAGGFDVVTANNGSSYPFTTSTMRKVLLKLGFYKVTDNTIKKGDIGWKAGHTEMAYSDGTTSAIYMGAHTGNAKLVNQVSIGNSSGDATATRSFTENYRYENGATGGYGCSPYVIAAICGNFWQESGINPGIWENLSSGNWTDELKGYGLGQWTNYKDEHGRLYKLHQYLVDNGYAVDDGYGQLEFLIYENTWQHIEAFAEFQSLSDFLNSMATNIEYLVKAWMRCWEGIWDGTYNKRVAYANKVHQYIVDNAQNTDIDTWVSGNFYTSEDEALNNAVLIYRWLSAGGGGGGTSSKGSSSGMPIYMMLRNFYKI